MVRFRDILKGTIFEDRINLVIDDAKNNWLRDLGKNDYIHSSNIEEYLDRLVPDDIKRKENIFGNAEIFLLIYAIYLHDIGRSEDGEHHEKETYKKIISNPEKYYLKNEFEAYAVAEICYGHAKESEKPIKSIRPDYGIAGLSNKVLNLQFLAALLRLADEVDNVYTRVQGIKNQKGSVRNLIRFINFDTDRWIIEFQSEPTNWKDWTDLKKMRSYTQNRLDEIREILESKELLYYQIWLDPKDFSKIQTPRPIDIELKELKQFVGNLISQQPFYDKQFRSHIVDIYFEERIKGQNYRNAVFVNKEICEDSIYELKEIFNNLRNNNEIEQGFIVVEKISKEISELATEETIKIITVHDLIREVANFSEYLKNYVKYYEDTPIFKKDCYIQLTANLETKENVGMIDDYLDTWLRSEGQFQLTVLGDYGTGKSTLSKRLEYRQAKKYLENSENERIPILIELKTYQKSISIESLITDLLINKYSVEIKNFNSFKLLNESGKLLLILDGFDEMASRVDKKVTMANFREFDKLISENSKVILTCRTHYFKNQDEIHKLHQGTEIYKKIDAKGGYTLLFLNSLKEEDFVIYLKKFFPENWEKYHRTIINTYNLRELAEKPILLELMVQTLPQIKIEENEKLNHASLYDRYTKFWLNRDDWRSYLESTEREFITEEIAFYLFINNIDRIFYEELPKLIQEKFPAKRIFEMEYLDQDVRTCTFLNRDEKGDYSFVHQSFMEFFVAKKFANEIKNKNSNNFGLKKLSPEIAGFLKNLTDQFEPFNKLIESTKNKSFDEVKYLGGNSATIANLMGADFSEMDMSSTVLIGANFDNAKLINSNLSNAIFSIKQLKETLYEEVTSQADLYLQNYLEELKTFKDLHALKSPDFKNKKSKFEKRIFYELNDLLRIYPDFRDYIKPETDIENQIYIIENLIKKKQSEEKGLLSFEDELRQNYIFQPKSEVVGRLIERNHKISTNFSKVYSEEITEKKVENILTTFVEANLKGANLSNADLRGLNLRGANLVGVNLIGAILSGVNLRNADLRDADLRSSDLISANLNQTNLRGAKLIRAKLNGANLSNADLTDADLREANLISANIMGAKLSGTNMTGAVR